MYDLFSCVYIRVQLCLCVHVCESKHECMFVSVSLCVYVRVYECECECVCFECLGVYV